MHMYIVKANTKCKLLTQEQYKDIKIDDFVTTKKHEFGDENLVIDYVRFKNSKQPANSVATKLAAKGYSIFCTKSVNDKYLIAVPSPAVEVL